MCALHGLAAHMGVQTEDEESSDEDLSEKSEYAITHILFPEHQDLSKWSMLAQHEACLAWMLLTWLCYPCRAARGCSHPHSHWLPKRWRDSLCDH